MHYSSQVTNRRRCSSLFSVFAAVVNIVLTGLVGDSLMEAIHLFMQLHCLDKG